MLLDIKGHDMGFATPYGPPPKMGVKAVRQMERVCREGGHQLFRGPLCVHGRPGCVHKWIDALWLRIRGRRRRGDFVVLWGY